MNIYLNNSKLIFLIIYIQIIFFLILTFPLNLSLESYQNILILIFFECVLISFLDSKFNLYQIFLLMMFLFSVAIPFFIKFNLYSYPPGNRFLFGDGITISLSNEIIGQTYFILSVMLLGTSVGWLISKLTLNMNISRVNNLPKIILNNRFRKIIKILFFLFFPLVIYNNALLFYYSLIYGYVEVMHLNSIDLNNNIIFTIADTLYKVIGFSLLFISRTSREYIINSFLIMIPYLIQIATGARGETIAVLLTLIFIYTLFFKKINLKKIIPMTIIIFIVSTILGAYRFTRNLSGIFYSFSFSDLIVLGIVSNASSIGVLSYTIQLKDKFFNEVPFLLGYVQGIFSFAPNYTIEGIQDKNYLAQHLTYMINSKKLFGGSTVGTSQIAEFFEFANGNLIIIFLLSVLLIYFACFLISKLNNNVFMFYIGALYLELLWIAPRGSIMKIFSKETVIAFLFLFIIMLIYRFNKLTLKKT